MSAYQFPQTQSLPDLSLSLRPISSSDDDTLDGHHFTTTVQPPLDVDSLGQPARGRDKELDDDNDSIFFPPPEPPSDTRQSLSKQSSKLPYDSGAGKHFPPLPPSRTPSSNVVVVTPRSRQPSTTDYRPQRHNTSRSNSRTNSSRSSSISSLGSIHSAPELLQLPLAPPSSPPELVRNGSSTTTNYGPPVGSGGGGGKRQSIAIMQQHSKLLDESLPSTSPRQEEGGLRASSPDNMTGAEETEEEVEFKRRDSPKKRPKTRRRKREFPNTLWEYLKQEVFTVEVDGEEGIKSERVTNFLTVPKELEKIIFFGFIICLDSFLYTFTILPLRSLASFVSLCSNHLSSWLWWRPRTRSLKLSQKCDLIKMVIVVITVVSLHRVTDASKMYHGVRGQETIKLYVLFNVLEIADRLCCSFGQDLSDSLFSTSALSRSRSALPSFRPLFLFTLYALYVISHSLVLFYQLVTLNVAVNSYSNALLTLLLSNQFVEIKGSVFKKFEKENLFQLTCADIVERFQLALMLFIISLRNLLELSTSIPTSSPPTSASSTGTSFLPTPTLLLTTFSPALTVLISECFVDWLKHAFITKFNHIRPKVYGRYMDVLCKDLIKGQAGNTSSNFIDQSPSVSRRLGFAALPLSCLVIRVFFQAFRMLGDESGLDECLMPSISNASSFMLEKNDKSFTLLGREIDGGLVEKVFEELVKWSGVLGICIGIWICLITLKLLIGINLRTFASERWNGVEKLEREEEDYKNGRTRGGIGVSKSEAIEMEKTNKLLRDKTFDQPGKPGGGGGGKDKVELEDLGRYDMVRSRLW